jgi:hypothetical protein
MANRNIWAKRAAAWRASGQSSVEFAKGKGFTAGGLRHMDYRLRSAAAKRPAQKVRLARVMRAVTPAPAAAPEKAAVVVVAGALRVEVHPGASCEVLAMVLKLLRAR